MTHVPSESELLRSVDRVLDRVPSGASADVRYTVSEATTMRFANSYIHQPHLERARLLSVRIASDQRLGTATTSDVSASGMDAIIREASALSQVAPKEHRFPGFPNGDSSIPPTSFHRGTALLSPERSAKLAGGALQAAGDRVPGARVSGVINAGYQFLAVGNTSDLRRTTRRSFVESSVLVDRPELDPPPSGWSEGASWNVNRLDVAHVGREAAERVPATSIRSVRPGTYRVLLAGPAMAELLGWFGQLGFGGHAEEEGWSCLSRSRGKRIFPTDLTIVDEARSDRSIPAAIDYEGVATRRTFLLDEGRVGGPVLDQVTAGRLGRSSTGHGVPPESPWGELGPTPEHIIFPTGNARPEELVRSVRRGLLVTRFHYVRSVHLAKGTITGMTRDGTYLIERGQLGAPVRNLRFTESVVKALQSAELRGRDFRCYADERGGSCVTTPAMVVGAFRFTSATLF
jgi:predicted Zn-dependent protease